MSDTLSYSDYSNSEGVKCINGGSVKRKKDALVRGVPAVDICVLTEGDVPYAKDMALNSEKFGELIVPSTVSAFSAKAPANYPGFLFTPKFHLN